MMKLLVYMLMGTMLLLAGSVISAEEAVEAISDSARVNTNESMTNEQSEQFVISYLHMNRRCSTCKKLQAFSEEAVQSGFIDELKDSSLVWRITNFEEEGNEHFAKDYGLYSQSLILSKMQDGKEVEWKNLDQIWKLVHNKDDFISYVQTEVKDFMNVSETK